MLNKGSLSPMNILLTLYVPGRRRTGLTKRLTLILMNTSLTAGSSSLQRLSETLGLHPGDAALFINGQNIDLDTHTPFR